MLMLMLATWWACDQQVQANVKQVLDLNARQGCHESDNADVFLDDLELPGRGVGTWKREWPPHFQEVGFV